jgi:hypothetical protein
VGSREWVGGDRSVAVLRHLLTGTDGAPTLAAQAHAIGVGAQLKSSETSKRLLEPHAEPKVEETDTLYQGIDFCF